MDHRFSLSINSARLSNPIADSTWIDGQSTLSRPTICQLSPKHRSNSSVCLNGSYANEAPQNNTLHQTSTNISRGTRQRLNLSQVDPKTYADVHSSGLASRIVKYHMESRGGLQRSMSFNHIHQPIIQPRRSSIATSPLSHKPSLPSLSMTRIAPPERSFYCGNTLPSLLRSNSLLGIEKCSDPLSRENRPILHPQPLEHENEPTRSVLEELKEISRKRINSDDIQQNEYNTKKSCNRVVDFVDHHNMHSHPYPHSQPLSALQTPTGVKRHRELSVAVPLRMHHSPIVLPLQHHHLQQQQQQHLQNHQLQQQQQQNQLHMKYGGSNNNHSPQQSPEQIAKRRNCSYSNDISSSLSSSKLHSNKRKLYDMREKVRLDTGNTRFATSCGSRSPDNSPTQHAAKIQRRQPMAADLRLEHLTKSQSTPITTLPATSAQRAVSAPILPQAIIQEKTETVATASPRPKLTLFNTQQLQCKQPERTVGAESLDTDVDAGEYAGIHFVKPKQQNSFNGIKNSHVERTQKTKLALMLSSLKGEIYQNDAESETRLSDEPDAKQLQPIVTTTTAATLVVTTVTATTPTITGTSSEKTTSTTLTTSASDATITKPADAKIAISASTVTTIPTTTAAETVIPTTKSVILSMTTITPASSTAQTSNNSLNLISFNNSATTTKPLPPANSEVSSNLKANSSSVLSGLKLTTNTTNAATAPITFDSPKTADTTNQNEAASIKKSIAPTVPVLTSTTTSTGVFSFGNTTVTAATTTNASAVSVTTSPITSPTFTFCNATTPAASAATAVPTTATDASAKSLMFTFGSAAPTKSTMVADSTTTNKTTTFSFGNISNNKAVPAFKMDNWAPKPLETVSDSSQNLDNTFKAPTSTAAPTNIQNTTAASKAFSFGTNTSTTTASVAGAIVPTGTPIFGQAVATPSFSFNSATTATTTAPLAASTSSNNSPGIFTFAASGTGGTPAVVKPVAKATPFSLPTSNKTNVFSFGGGTGGITTKTSGTATASSSLNFSATPTAPPAANKNSFSFNATPKQTPIFGSGTTENATAAKPFTFGGTAAATEQQPQSTVAAAPGGGGGGFSFAAVAQKNESVNLFGTLAATSVVNPSFNFGGNPAPSMTSTGTTAPAPAAFGGFATPAAPVSKPFTFGAGPPASDAASPMGGNLFASAVAATQQQQNKPGGFFSTTNNSNGVAPAPANANAPFAFGGATSLPQMNSTPKPFAFGATSATTPTPNIFASPTPAPTHGGPAFNFGSTTSPVPGNTPRPDMHGGPTAQQVNSGNVFALPNTPESRPIRRATRRLQK
ncbi:mucin-5AC [Drosophila nasuta]|uniref:mucin-5AC n=1 Tax=Drosophila nasuta TaxID=42062 RepID=UPI00295E25AF|nr:mucin-5AC [Drosophila nasuta]